MSSLSVTTAISSQIPINLKSEVFKVKDAVLYIVLSLIGVYTAYQCYVVRAQVQILNSEYGYCFESNNNLWTVFFGSLALYACTMGPIIQWATGMFQKIIPQQKFTLDSKIRQEKAEIMADKAYRLFLYIIFTVSGFNFFKDTPYLHTHLLGTEQSPQYFADYPCAAIPKYLEEFIFMKIAFYVYDTIVILPTKRDSHDFLELFLHHILALTLFIFGYSLQLHTLGSIIVMLDCSDIFLSIFRLLVDIHEVGQIVAYVFLLISWAYFRLYMLPFHYIVEVWSQGMATGNEIAQNAAFLFCAFFSLICLLSLYWFWLMIKGLIRRLTVKYDKTTVLLANN